ncbi:MAG: sulfotransferase, partial [Gammaproteobacteria bacterium]
AGERSELGLLALATAGDGRVYPESVEQLVPDQIAIMGRHYLDAVCPPGPGPIRVTDKMWQNFEYLGLAELMLPGARVIHCVRDPLDCGLSCFSQHFLGSGVAFSYDLADIGAFMIQYRRIMTHWQRVLALPMFELRYETLVAKPEATIRELLAFLDLPWDPACLEFHRHRREVRTASFDQVRRPLYQSSVGRHRGYRRWLTPLIEALEKDK